MDISMYIHIHGKPDNISGTNGDRQAVNGVINYRPCRVEQ